MNDLYGGTYRLFTGVRSHSAGLTVSYVDMTDRAALERRLNELLEPGRFKDYGPNGLQVEGRAAVNHVVCGVTASLALIDAAIAAALQRGDMAARYHATTRPTWAEGVATARAIAFARTPTTGGGPDCRKA